MGMPIPVVITVYSDRSFTFIKKTPPAAVLLRKAAKIEKGSAVPNTNKVGKVTRAQIEEIAQAENARPDGSRTWKPQCARLRAARAAPVSTWRASNMAKLSKRMQGDRGEDRPRKELLDR